MFGGLDRIALTSTVEKGGIEGTARLQGLLGGHARGAAAESDAVPVGHAAPRPWLDRRQPRPREPVRRHEPHAVLVPRATRRSSRAPRTDEVIDSNDNKRYPFLTVLEFLRGRFAVPPDQVAVFGSWETFHWIAQHEDGARCRATPATRSARARIRRSTRSAVRSSRRRHRGTARRHDAYTFRFAMDHLRRVKPRVIYIALDETDATGRTSGTTPACSTRCTARTAT